MQLKLLKGVTLSLCLLSLAACGHAVKSASGISNSDAGEELRSATGVVQPKKKTQESPRVDQDRSINRQSETILESPRSDSSGNVRTQPTITTPTTPRTQAPSPARPSAPPAVPAPKPQSPADVKPENQNSHQSEELNKIEEWNDEDEIEIIEDNATAEETQSDAQQS